MLRMTDHLEQSFTDYEEMQTRHTRSYSEELKPDIEKQNFERDRVFENLKNDLTNMLNAINKKHTDGNRTDIAHACKERIQTIMDQDRILMDRLVQYRDGLIKHLGKLDLGKRALKGYRSHYERNDRTRFMDKSG